MIPFNDTSPLHRNTILLLINAMLRVYRCFENYRVESTGIIRPSTSHPPTSQQKDAFRLAMQKLKSIHLIDFSETKISMMLSRRIQNIDAIKIMAINSEVINKFLNVHIAPTSSDSKPNFIEPAVWDMIPQEIKSRWPRFSEPMQKHIADCTSARLPDLFAKLVTTKVLGDTFRSPISFEPPKIPVRLPRTNKVVSSPSGEADAVYDLLEILAIQQREPGHPERRQNPITRDYFSLDEVLPGTNALLALKERALGGGEAAAAPDEDDSIGYPSSPRP